MVKAGHQLVGEINHSSGWAKRFSDNIVSDWAESKGLANCRYRCVLFELNKNLFTLADLRNG
jgi:hypothetical protein